MPKNKKILLVLDDQSLDKILTYLLKAWNYEVLLCPDGNQALAIAAQKHPDLILIDAHLTHTDGLKLCKILKHDFITAYIPIVILIEKKQLRRNLLDIEQGVDDFLIKPPDPIDLEIRLALSLKNANHQFHANALTKLPGNRSIEEQTKMRLEQNAPFSFAYLDINNFKSFNDKYGYMAGDRAILQSAKIISETVRHLGERDDFVGHIGGDDFVYITTPQKTERIAQECLNEFDRLLPLHYSAEDRKRGFIHVKDRRGQATDTPLMGLSIAIVNSETSNIHSIHELIETASEIKKFLKKQYGTSQYLVNRRAVDAGAQQRKALEIQYERQIKTHPHPRKSFKPLGQILLKTRLINEEQLSEALNYHWQTGQRIGEAAVALGFVHDQDVQRLLEHQPTFHHVS
jgi:diguanylate cyclase (GGDEF)-like protein